MSVIIMGMIGLTGGLFAGCGLCAVLTSVGIITRLAWRTKTTTRIRLYENMIFLGAVISNITYLYEIKIFFPIILKVIMMGTMGIFYGIFVGCLSAALSESLDASTIVFRRIKISKNTKYILLAVALGKFVGNYIYFFS